VLRNKQILNCKLYRQYGVGEYILDFFCPNLKLAIEIDGGQHNSNEGIETDMVRTKFLEQQNIKVIRFWNNEVSENFDGVVKRIWDVVEEMKMDE